MVQLDTDLGPPAGSMISALDAASQVILSGERSPPSPLPPATRAAARVREALTNSLID